MDPRVEELLRAAGTGDGRRVRKLLAQGVSPDVSDASKKTPLIAAACRGRAEVVRILIERLEANGADAKTASLNATDNGDWSALRCAARMEPVGMQPGWAAAGAMHLQTVRLLIAAEADVNLAVGGAGTPLLGAARTRQLPIVRELLRAGARVDARDREGRTALWHAANSVPLRSHGEGPVQETSLPVIAALLEAGAAVDARDREGRTPLFAAAARGHASIVRTLLAAGADPNAAADRVLGRGSRPLVEAAGRGQAAVVSLLVAAGAEVNATTADGRTALMEAAASGAPAAVRTLLDAGADVNAVARYVPATALMVAARQGNLEMVRLLHGRGARMDKEEIATLYATGDPRILQLLQGAQPVP